MRRLARRRADKDRAHEHAGSSGGQAPAGSPFVPGACLLRPAPLFAAAIIVVNLVYLKARHPGWWSGKLSDFAICFFLPVVLVALYEWSALALGRRRPAGKWVLLGACAVTAVYFSALQLVPFVAMLHVDVLGRLVRGRQFAVTQDPSDLLALPFIVLSYLWLRREGGRRSAPSRP